MASLIRLLSNAKSRYFLSSSSINLEYRIVENPDRDTVLMVHGAGSDCRIFVPNMDRLAQDFQVLVVSLRGHGLSDKPKVMNEEAFSKNLMLRDLIELTWSLGIQNFHFVGHSLGGLLGYELLRQDALSLLSLCTISCPAQEEGLKGSLKIMNKASGFSLATLGKRKKQAEVAAKMTTSDPDTEEFLRNEVFYGTDWNEAKLLRPQLSGDNYLEDIKNAPCPVLLMEGQDDAVERSLGVHKSMAQTMEALGKPPHVTHLRIPESGFFPNLDQPEVFHQALRDWLLATPNGG